MIKYGVPQGSVLGPLLFLIYINDLPENIGDADSVLYADDTTIFSSKKDEFLDSLKRSGKWFRENALSINPEKCNLVSFGNNQLSTITYASQKFENILETKYLGFIIDKNLTFKSHIEKIANKLRKFNGILYKTRDYFSKRQLLRFYDAYAKSIIEYGILIYGSASKSDLETIHIIQKRILRTILWKKFCDWTQEEVIKYKIYSVYELYAAHLLKEVFNQIRDNSPMKLLDLDEMHGVKTTRRTAANILPTISFKTKKRKNHSRENLR